MGNCESPVTEAMNRFRRNDVCHFVFGDIFLYDIRSYRKRQLTYLLLFVSCFYKILDSSIMCVIIFVSLCVINIMPLL